MESSAEMITYCCLSYLGAKCLCKCLLSCYGWPTSIADNRLWAWKVLDFPL